MALEGEYLGMPVHVDDLDQDNLAFYTWCGKGELRLQQCTSCGLKRYPPTTACPWCASPHSTWEAVAGRGTLYSYGEVHHAIQPVFREFAPYLLLLVELEEQRDHPAPYDGLRITGNLADADGQLASADLVRQVGIGSLLKVVFISIGNGIALPLWCLDDDAEQPNKPWRYPDE